MRNKKIGKFYVSTELLNSSAPIIEEMLYKMRFTPYRVEHLYHANRFEYIGTSPLFNELEEGMEAPEYNIKINDVEGITAELV